MSATLTTTRYGRPVREPARFIPVLDTEEYNFNDEDVLADKNDLVMESADESECYQCTGDEEDSFVVSDEVISYEDDVSEEEEEEYSSSSTSSYSESDDEGFWCDQIRDEMATLSSDSEE